MERASEELKDAVKVGVAGLLENVGRALRSAAEPEERAPPRARREPRSGVRVDVAPPVSDEDVEEDLAALRERVARKGERRE